MNVLLTGASGFLGRKLAKELRGHPEFTLALALRSPLPELGAASHVIGEISGETDWSAAIAGQDVVIHAAALAHVMKATVADSLAEYHRVNVEGTLSLARQAAAAGVKRFVFIGSIAVNANINIRQFRREDQPGPVSRY